MSDHSQNDNHDQPQYSDDDSYPDRSSALSNDLTVSNNYRQSINVDQTNEQVNNFTKDKKDEIETENMIQAITQEAERERQKQAQEKNQYEQEQRNEEQNLNPTNEQEQNRQNKHNEHENEETNEQNQDNDDKSNTQQQNQHIDLQQLQTNQQNDNEGQVVENMEIVGKQISMEEIQRQEEHQDIPVPGLEIIGTKIQTGEIHNFQNSEEEHLSQNVENDADVNYAHQNQGVDSNQEQQQSNSDLGEQFKQNKDNSIPISQSTILEPSPTSQIMSVHTSKIRGPSYEDETNLPTNVWVERGSEEFLPGSGSQPNIVPEYSETYEDGERHGYENKNQFNELKQNPQLTEAVRQNIHDNQQVVHEGEINQQTNKGHDDDEDIIEDVQKIKYQPHEANQDGKTQEQSVYMVNSLSNIAVVHRNVSQQKKDETAIIEENKESIRSSFNDNDESRKNTDNSYYTKGTEKNEKLSQIIDSRYVPEIEPVSKPSLVKVTDDNISGHYEAPPVIEQQNQTTPILEPKNQGSNVESIYSRRVLPSATKNKEIPLQENSQGAQPNSCVCNIM